eukprot:TCONS_00053569-protein
MSASEENFNKGVQVMENLMEVLKHLPEKLGTIEALRQNSPATCSPPKLVLREAGTQTEDSNVYAILSTVVTELKGLKSHVSSLESKFDCFSREVVDGLNQQVSNHHNQRSSSYEGSPTRRELDDYNIAPSLLSPSSLWPQFSNHQSHSENIEIVQPEIDQPLNIQIGSVYNIKKEIPPSQDAIVQPNPQMMLLTKQPEDSINQRNRSYQQSNQSKRNAKLRGQETKRGRCMRNGCAIFIRQQLAKSYTSEELASRRVNASRRTYQKAEINSSALSPNRLKVIMNSAKALYKDEFEKLHEKGELNEIVNSKCRAVKCKLKKLK